MKILSTVIILIWSASVLFSGTIVGSFRAEPGFNRVLLKWTSEKEINLKGFEIERSFENRASTFRRIDFLAVSLALQDKKEYEYEDKTVFKSGDRTFYYRLKIVDEDGSSTHSDVVAVSPNISSTRHTWGSIKAMFR